MSEKRPVSKPVEGREPEVDTSYVELAMGNTPQSIESDAQANQQTRIESPVIAPQIIESPEQPKAAMAEVLERLRNEAPRPKPEAAQMVTSSEGVVASLSENIRQSAAERVGALNDLFADINIPPKGADIYTREQLQKEEAEGVRNRVQTVEAALVGERHYNEEKRGSFFKKFGVSAGVSLGASAIGGLGAALSGATFAGYAGAGLASAIFAGGVVGLGAPLLAIGAAGWGGMKLWHSIKEHRHQKRYERIFESP